MRVKPLSTEEIRKIVHLEQDKEDASNAYNNAVVAYSDYIYKLAGVDRNNPHNIPILSSDGSYLLIED